MRRTACRADPRHPSARASRACDTDSAQNPGRRHAGLSHVLRSSAPASRGRRTATPRGHAHPRCPAQLSTLRTPPASGTHQA